MREMDYYKTLQHFSGIVEKMHSLGFGFVWPSPKNTLYRFLSHSLNTYFHNAHFWSSRFNPPPPPPKKKKKKKKRKKRTPPLPSLFISFHISRFSQGFELFLILSIQLYFLERPKKIDFSLQKSQAIQIIALNLPIIELADKWRPFNQAFPDHLCKSNLAYRCKLP